MSRIISVMLLLVLSGSGCSVYKAASNDGIAPEDIKMCNAKECFLSRGMEIVEEKDTPEGEHVVTYRAPARKGGGTYGRAAGHAVLDVMTIGLWEVVGTPVEGALSNNRGFIVARVTYADKCCTSIKNIAIFDADGAQVK